MHLFVHWSCVKHLVIGALVDIHTLDIDIDGRISMW